MDLRVESERSNPSANLLYVCGGLAWSGTELTTFYMQYVCLQAKPMLR